MLDGVRVLDLTDERGWLAGKILGDMGADVIKIEPPDAASERPHGSRDLAWLALNTSKRGITLALDRDEGRALFERLLARSDVVLESFAPGTMAAWGLDPERLRSEHPRLVYCAITPFGQDGPHAQLAAHDLCVVAMGGNAAMTGEPDGAPLRCSMPTSYYHAAPEAALAVVMALYARESDGRGDRVDVSLQECQLATLLSAVAQYSLTGKNGRRAGARIGRTREIWRAKDGWVSFGLRGGAARVRNLEAAVAWMREVALCPPWLAAYDWASFNHNSLAREDVARLEEAFAAFFATLTMAELYDGALTRGILLAPCNDARAILEQPQLRARELFVTLDYEELGARIEHPAFFARCDGDGGGVRVRGRAPRPGEHNATVYGELGLARSELVELARRGVV